MWLPSQNSAPPYYCQVWVAGIGWATRTCRSLGQTAASADLPLLNSALLALVLALVVAGDRSQRCLCYCCDEPLSVPALT